MPWQVESKGKDASEHFKYQYHPGGDPNKAPKNAPSALHSVIVPNVNLPKVSGYLGARNTPSTWACEGCGACRLIRMNRSYTRSTTSGAKTTTRV